MLDQRQQNFKASLDEAAIQTKALRAQKRDLGPRMRKILGEFDLRQGNRKQKIANIQSAIEALKIV